MSYPLLSILILASLSIKQTDFELPATSTKDFTISLSHSGGMDGSSTYLTFNYDSCIYVRNSQVAEPKKYSFVLTKSDRSEILKKCMSLR